ncbi:hypothetical protein [Streptomyces sp. NBC_01716]|nr:hypothetical protein [Streptomyces sp. NBC_01716]
MRPSTEGLKELGGTAQFWHATVDASGTARPTLHYVVTAAGRHL